MFENLEKLNENIIKCNKCSLCNNKKEVGRGNLEADIMFVGENPGIDQDGNCSIFSGKSGKLLNQACMGVGINVDNIYMTNIMKCTNNENIILTQKEPQACLDYLRNQVILIKPKIVVLFGSLAVRTVLGNENSNLEVRGEWIEKKGIKYIATFHPSVLIKNENQKIDFWEDLIKVKNEAEKNGYKY